MRTGKGMASMSGPGRIVVGLVAVLCVTLGARAQMLPFVPDPVTTPEFVRYADMLELSDDQRLAALDVHDAYRREFRALEDGKVKEFIGDLTGLARVFTREGFRIPARSEFERLIEELDEIFTKAKKIDQGLFDGLAPILTESQLGGLPSVRIEREMDVYAHLMDAPGELNPSAPVVLSSVVRQIDLSEEEIARTQESLRQYERNAVQRMRKLYRLLKEAAEFALDTLDRTGLRDMTPLEMMQLGEDEAFEEDMRASFNEGSQPIQAELFAASQQNLALLRQLAPLLSPDNNEALRDRFYKVAYGRVYDGLAPWRYEYKSVMGLEFLGAERRQQLGAMREQFRRQEDQLTDRIVERVETWREYRTIAQLNEEDSDELEQRIEAYQGDIESLGESAMMALKAILTPEELASIERGERAGEDAPDDPVQTVAGGGGGEVEAEFVVESDESDRSLTFVGLGMPRALSTERRDQLARLARLDEGQRAVMASLHGDYREGYAAEIEQMTQEDASNRDDEDSAKEQEERFVSRMATLAALDDAFFESLGLVLEGEEASAAFAIGHGLRARGRARRAAQGLTFVFGREESYVDFVGVVLAMEQSVDIVAKTKTRIDRYGGTVGPLVDERLAAVRESQRQSRIAYRMEEHGRAGDRMAKKLEDKAAESWRKVSELDGRIRDENRLLLEEMQSALGEELGWTLRVAYQREAYPEVYEDELGMEAALAAVRALDDLTGPQSGRVERVVNDYRSAFVRLSERMVQLRRQREFDFTAMQMPSREVIEGEIELERLRFDRREAGSRAILRLRLLLDESQVARSGLRELPTLDRRAFE